WLINEKGPPRREKAKPTDRSTATVRLVGYLSAGTAHYFAQDSGQLDEVDAPGDVSEATVAVEIRGDSLGSFFDRWLVFYDDVRRPVSTDQIG
ncbi:hypothetical protein, partial [Escherichia coli]|uniref:hypothetical protein n=1 Tax=Escherichia coli TaxID=562 RepID=UPI003CE513BD